MDTSRLQGLFDHFTKEDVIVTDAGSSFFLTHHIPVHQGIRIITSGGFASMGYGIPASIGAYLALRHRTILITGDGSFSQSIPELQTIVHHRLPIKIFILNNGGYLSIRLTQKKYFSRFIGESKDSGMSLPSIRKIARAYGIPYTRSIPQALTYKTAAICEILMPHGRV